MFARLRDAARYYDASREGVAIVLVVLALGIAGLALVWPRHQPKTLEAEILSFGPVSFPKKADQTPTAWIKLQNQHVIAVSFPDWASRCRVGDTLQITSDGVSSTVLPQGCAAP
jgi:hypothetical protein